MKRECVQYMTIWNLIMVQCEDGKTAYVCVRDDVLIQIPLKNDEILINKYYDRNLAMKERDLFNSIAMIMES